MAVYSTGSGATVSGRRSPAAYASVSCSARLYDLVSSVPGTVRPALSAVVVTVSASGMAVTSVRITVVLTGSYAGSRSCTDYTGLRCDWSISIFWLILLTVVLLVLGMMLV